METFWIKALQLILALSLLVVIHELGHFMWARVFKIRVEKFYIFFNPWFSLLKWKPKKSDTTYGIGWVPLGGYVKIAGMIDESMDKEQLSQPARPDEFRSKPAWQRFLVMIAGVVMNIVLAVGIYIGICYTWGDTYFSNEDARWGYNFSDAGHDLGFRDGDRFVAIDGEPVVNPDRLVNALVITESDRRITVERKGTAVELTLPLEKLIALRQQKGYEGLFELRKPFLIDSVTAPAAAALQRGDEIVGIRLPNGERYDGLEFRDYKALLQLHAGETAGLRVLRGRDTLALDIPISADGRLGVLAANPYTLRTQHYTLAQAIPAGIRKTGRVIASYWEQLKLIVQPKTKMYEELGGFIAIGSIFPSEWNWEDFWMKTAFLSIILAVMNIIPIPGLDGGHALFTLWEIVTGRKVSDRVLEAAQYFGLVLILLLLVYANGNDIYRFFLK